MVQMKGEAFFVDEKRCFSLYIPHGSDESQNLAKKTSFDRNLYIPHGSDERKLPFFHPRKKATFISHMVQMKEDFYKARTVA